MKALIVNRETYEILCDQARPGLASADINFYFDDMVVCNEVEDISFELEELRINKGYNPSKTSIETARLNKRKKDEVETTAK